MKTIATIILGVSLLTSSLFSNEDKVGVHKNMDKVSGQGMLHGKMKPYHHMIMVDGYKAMVSSRKVLKKGTNDIIIVIMKGKSPMKNLDVTLEFSIADTKINKLAMVKGKSYSTVIDFNTNGHWMYELTFKTNDNKIHKTKGNMNIQ